MSDLSRSGSAVVHPSNFYSMGDLEMGKFRVENGTVSVGVDIVGGSIVVTSGTVVGDIADNAADSGNPVKVGGKYNASAPTYSDGDRVDDQHDVNGNKKVVETYAPVAEDNTVGVIKVEQRYSYSKVTADAQVKAGAGFLHTITITPLDAATAAGTVTFYDSLTEAAPAILSVYFVAAFTPVVNMVVDVSFATGLYIGFDADVQCSITTSYR